VAAVGPCGFAPVAPGTIGSFAGLALVWLLRANGWGWLEPGLLAVVLSVGVLASQVTETVYQRRDPGVIVIDEVAGMLVTLMAVPVGVGGAVLAFALFRVFDILKPFPARHAERLPGGWGVMADDVIAGIYAQLVLRALLAVGGQW
jgi:phosphatidylglycerophosphatase A